MKGQLGQWKFTAILSITAFATAMCLSIGSRSAASQSSTKARCLGCSVDGKTTPMTDGHPDLNGYWGGQGVTLNQGGKTFERTSDGSILYDNSLTQGDIPLCEGDACQDPNQPSYSTAYLPRVQAIAKSEFAGTTPSDPEKSCKPNGVPRAPLNGVQIIQTPQITAIVHGNYDDRLIYTDGRPHPADLEPSYSGDSIGHWEGNTLVVDVTGLNDDTWVGGGEAGDNAGQHMYTSIHSDKEHVVERWTREGDVLTYEATVDDPVAFTKPWVIPARKVHIDTNPDEYLTSYFCDGSGMSQLLNQHYVKPNPEDRDIRNHCNGHRCGAIDPSAK